MRIPGQAWLHQRYLEFFKVTTDSKSSSIEIDFDSFNYSAQYFDYHRNLIIFFCLTIFVGFFGISIDVEKFAYLSGHSEALTHYTPRILFAAGCYCGMMFYPEWKECALPHRAKTKKINDQLRISISELNEIHQKSLSDIPKYIEKIEYLQSSKYISSANEVIHQLSINAIEEFNNNLIEIGKVHEKKLLSMNQLIDLNYEYELSSGQKRTLINDFKSRLSDLTEEKKDDLEFAMQCFLDDMRHRFYREFSLLNNDISYAATNVREKFQEIYRGDWNQNQSIDEASSNNAKSIANILSIIRSSESSISKCLTIMRQATKVVIKSELHVFVKTTIGGAVIPIILGCTAFIAVCKFESAYQAEIEEKHQIPTCLSDLTISKYTCRQPSL